MSGVKDLPFFLRGAFFGSGLSVSVRCFRHTIGDGYVAFPLFVNNKITKTKIAAIVPQRVLDLAVTHKLGTLRITKKGDKYIAQIAYP